MLSLSITTPTTTQFEPEAFVDGLLGIGKAGGKSSANEGALLNQRLVQLRKDRDEQAKMAKKAIPAKAAMATAGAAGELTFQEMDARPQPTKEVGSGTSKTSNNRNRKKKKKGKR